MTQKTKQRLAALLTALTMGLSLAGCSGDDTPSSSKTDKPAFENVDRSAVVMTVNGDDITVGDYLPYLYNSLDSVLSSDGAQLYSSADDLFSLLVEYRGKEYPVDEYVHQLAQDSIRSAYVIRSLMKEYDVKLSDEQEKELADSTSSLDAEQAKLLGFTLESYTNMVRSAFYEDHALFDGLYGKGGALEVSEEELKTFFDDNFISFLLLRVELTDAQDKELSVSEKQKVLSRLNTYQTYYQQDGNFEKLVAYEEGDRNIAYADFKGDTSKVNCRLDEVVKTFKDTELAAIVQSMRIGEVRVAQYHDQSNIPCAALILRVKPGADGMTDEEYYEACRDSLLYYTRFDTFEALLREKMDALDTTVNADVEKQLDPREYYVLK